MLKFLTALLTVLPRLLDEYRKWQEKRRIEKDKAAKDSRNEKAIRDALPPTPP